MKVLKNYFMEKAPNEIKKLDEEYINKIEKISDELDKLNFQIFEALYENGDFKKYNELIIIRSALIEEKERYEEYSNELLKVVKKRKIYLARLYKTNEDDE